jgi:hypothetical protein
MPLDEHMSIISGCSMIFGTHTWTECRVYLGNDRVAVYRSDRGGIELTIEFL